MIVRIRPASPPDVDTWWRLWRAYQLFYAVELPDSTSRVTWERLLDEREPMIALFAEVDGAIVGFAHAIEHRSCWAAGNTLYLQDLYVSPVARGRGIGRALIAQVYATAGARGCARVNWLTQQSNVGAMALYDRVATRTGFIQYTKVL